MSAYDELLKKYSPPKWKNVNELLKTTGFRQGLSIRTSEIKDKGDRFNAYISQINRHKRSGNSIDQFPEKYTKNTGSPTDDIFANDGAELEKLLGTLKEQVNELKDAPGGQPEDVMRALQLSEDTLADILNSAQGYQQLMKLLHEAIKKDTGDTGLDDDQVTNLAGADPLGGMAGAVGSRLAADVANAAAREAERIAKEIKDRVTSNVVSVLDPNENYLELSFRDQCYIQRHLWSLVDIRRGGNFRKKRSFPTETRNASLMCGGTPYGFINKLTSHPSAKTFFDMPHDVLSNLQPSVRLYKVRIDEEGSEMSEMEITFPGSTTSSDIRDIFKNKRRRGFGVGMKSFEWVMEGSDPFASKRMIMGKLTLHATNFAEILRDRETFNSKNESEVFRYADLAIKTGTTRLEELKTEAQCRGTWSDSAFDPAYSLNFRLKVVVGYQIPQKLHMPEKERAVYENAIANSYATYDLIPTIHEFNFKEDGRVDFVINYQAYVQDAFNNSYYDVFADSNDANTKIFKINMQKKFDAATNKASGASAAAADDDLKAKDDAKIIKGLKERNLKGVLTRLFKKDLIYFYSIPYTELNRAMSDASIAPIYDSSDNLQNEDQIRNEINRMTAEAQQAEKLGDYNAEQKLKKKIERLEGELTKPSHLSSSEQETFNYDTYRQVTFFFMFDLVDIILEGIQNYLDAMPKTLSAMKTIGDADASVKQREMRILAKAKQNFMQLRVLLGPIEIRDANDPYKYRTISMGEIPISLKYFTEWMADKMLAKDRVSYPLATFLDEFIKNYLSVFLNDATCNGIKATQPVAFHSTTICSYSDSVGDEITNDLHARNVCLSDKDKTDVWIPDAVERPVLNTMGTQNTKGSRNPGYGFQRNWMVYYAGRTKPEDKMTGDAASDEKMGISHYVLGESKGIVKEIRLEKSPAPMIKEMRYEQEGYDGLLQLREVYNANIDLFLIPNVYPGTILYIDPRGFAPSTKGMTAIDEDGTQKFGNLKDVDRMELSRYGIGGYYLVTKASHRIAEGERTTNVTAVWMHGHENESPPPTKVGVDKNPAVHGFQKCGAKKHKESIRSYSEMPPRCKSTVDSNPNSTP